MSKKSNIPTGKLTLELTTKTVWAGMYGGHYDVIVFFKTKPVVSQEQTRSGDNIYDCLENKDIVVGDMYLSDFREVYPDADLSNYLQDDRPKETEIIEVFRVKLTTLWDKYGKMVTIDCNADGWNS